MPIRDHDLTISHMTARDPSLDHQVVLQNSTRGKDINASCNCRQKYNTGNVRGYAPIGVVKDLEEARIMYNEPSNHWKPFSALDVAKW